jgi:hypothetical protein
MYKEAITSGLIGELGGNRWATLCVLASHMKEDGTVYLSQDKIAEYMGICRETANLRIKSLLEFRFHDKPVLTLVSKDGGFTKRCNVYHVEPISQLAIFNGLTESVEVLDKPNTYMLENPNTYTLDKPHTNYNPINNNPINNNKDTDSGQTELKNGKDVINYFCHKYRETYTANYAPSWGRDVKLVKDKLIANYSMDQIKAILDVVFKEYDTRWAKPKYPRPTIGALTTWLSNEAITIIQVEEKKKVDFEKSLEVEETDYEKARERMRRRRLTG